MFFSLKIFKMVSSCERWFTYKESYKELEELLSSILLNFPQQYIEDCLIETVNVLINLKAYEMMSNQRRFKIFFCLSIYLYVIFIVPKCNICPLKGWYV